MTSIHFAMNLPINGRTIPVIVHGHKHDGEFEIEEVQPRNPKDFDLLENATDEYEYEIKERAQYE